MTPYVNFTWFTVAGILDFIHIVVYRLDNPKRSAAAESELFTSAKVFTPD